MRTSEHHRPASDDVMREVVRQLVDQAPPAPDWNSLGEGDLVAAPPPAGPPWRQLLLVAAVVMVVVGGLWWLRSPEPDVPADRPTITRPTVPVTAPPPPPVALSDLDPIEAQLCLTRKNLRLLVAMESVLVSPDTGLAGYTPDRARMSLFAAPVNVFASIADHPDLDPDTAARLRSIVDAYRSADDLGFAGADGAEAAGFADAVDDLAAEFAIEVEASSDAAICTVALDPGAESDELRSSAQCVAAARLDAALVLGSTGALADDRVVAGAAAGLRGWYDPVPADVTELVALADELTLLPVDERASAVTALRAELDPWWKSEDSPCSAELVEP